MACVDGWMDDNNPKRKNQKKKIILLYLEDLYELAGVAAGFAVGRRDVGVGNRIGSLVKFTKYI